MNKLDRLLLIHYDIIPTVCHPYKTVILDRNRINFDWLNYTKYKDSVTNSLTEVDL